MPSFPPCLSGLLSCERGQEDLQPVYRETERPSLATWALLDLEFFGKSS